MTAMERPALQRLLIDVREGHIDVVVVYKVDRLTARWPANCRMTPLAIRPARVSARGPQRQLPFASHPARNALRVARCFSSETYRVNGGPPAARENRGARALPGPA